MGGRERRRKMRRRRRRWCAMAAGWADTLI